MPSPAARARRQRVIVVVVVLLIIIVGVAVVAERAYGRTRVSQILARPDYYQGRIVIVTGEVSDSYSILNTGIMQINDGTGAIWVRKVGPVPAPGSRASVRGRVNTVLQIGPITAVGIEAL